MSSNLRLRINRNTRRRSKDTVSNSILNSGYSLSKFFNALGLQTLWTSLRLTIFTAGTKLSWISKEKLTHSMWCVASLRTQSKPLLTKVLASGWAIKIQIPRNFTRSSWALIHLKSCRYSRKFIRSWDWNLPSWSSRSIYQCVWKNSSRYSSRTEIFTSSFWGLSHCLCKIFSRSFSCTKSTMKT